MRNNQYTERMDSIRAPKAAVDRAVKAAIEADKNGKVIPMETVMDDEQPDRSQRTGRKHKLIRVISAVAACAVLTAGVTIAGVMTKNGKGGAVHNGFSLTANAAALKKGSSVEILSIQGHEPSGRGSLDADGKHGYALMEEYLTFTVECEGEDIRSVNYSVKNGVFYLGSWQTVLEEGSVKCEKYTFTTAGDTAKTVPAAKDKMNQPDDEQPRAFDTGSGVELTGNNLYTAYTVPFDKQNMLSSYAAEVAEANFYDPDGTAIKTDFPSCAIATCISTNDQALDQQVKDTMLNYHRSEMDDAMAKVAYAEYVSDAYDRAAQNGESEPSGLMDFEEFKAKNDNTAGSFDKDKDFKIVYDALINDITIDVTVTYNDGSTETSSLQLSCEKVENGIVTVGAKLV